MDVFKMARELGKEIQKDPRFAKIDAAKRANDGDSELQDMIEVFNTKRVELNQEVSKNDEDKDTDKLTKMDTELKEMYQKIISNKNMVEFNAAKVEVDEMMNFISEILFASVNGDDPDTVEHEEGCGGNCGSCGGCH